MRKTLIILGIIIGIIGTPMLAMSISPTRDLLLGMTSDEAVLALADKIDESRVSTEQANSKIAELQSTIDSQKAQLTNYQQQIETQNSKIETVNTAIKTTNETVAIQKDCTSDINKYCSSESFKYPSEFSNFLKAYEKFDNYSEYKSKFTTQFNNCQKALKCD